MQDDFRGFRRFPTAEKKIKDIEPEDIRVGFIGTITNKTKGKISVDDGTGSIDALFEEDIIKGLETGKLVRIVGKMSEGTLKGESIQDFSSFDLDLYMKIRSIEGKSI